MDEDLKSGIFRDRDLVSRERGDDLGRFRGLLGGRRGVGGYILRGEC